MVVIGVQGQELGGGGGGGGLTLCEIESVSEARLEYGMEEAGFEMGAEGFAVKGKVVLVTSTSVTGRVLSETVGEDRASGMSL